MKLISEEHIVGLGVSRGLGRAWLLNMCEHIQSLNFQANSKLLIASRKMNLLDDIKAQIPQINIGCRKFDFSDQLRFENYLQEISEFDPTRLFYFAGGGPFGNFGTKKWSDHEWAFKVNFIFPSYFLHTYLNKPELFPNLKQIVFVGSSIAESEADPGASSYAAAKHALKGLILSLQLEYPEKDIRLFSPGYIDTAMLPPNAKPRHDGSLINNADLAASKLVNWVLNEDKDYGEQKRHLVIP